MDAGVDKSKHPDRCGHVAHTGPHAHHGASMVVSLQRGAKLALGQDDEGIEDFIELAQVEDPAVEGQSLVPDATRVRATGSSITGERNIAGVRHPLAISLIVEDGISKTGWAMGFSHAVHEALESLRPHWVHDTALHDAHHVVEGPCRVNGQEDIVGNDEGME